MATVVTPGKDRHRSFFIYSLPALLVGTVTLGSWVIVETRSLFISTPIFFVAFSINRHIRWSMIWVSTSDEQKLLAKKVDYEPVLSLFREWIRRKDYNK